MKETFRYKKEMGQNFIFDPALIDQLAEASCVQKTDGVLEIGPGRGTLTAALAQRARKVLTVELDRTLIDDLEISMALYPNVEVVQGDILKADLAALVGRLGTPCRLAANLPYNITTPLVEKLLHARLPFLTMAIMVQKEVGQRMMARPGGDGYGPLSLLVDYYAIAQEAVFVPSGCFTPPPKVDSSFMLLTMRDAPKVTVRDEKLLFSLIRAAFSMRRKTILNNIAGSFMLTREAAAALLSACGVEPMARAEQLRLEDFAAIADALDTPR